MKSGDVLEILYVPTTNGMMRISIYGFQSSGTSGYVQASLNDITVTEKGINRKKTVVKCVSSLHEMIMNSPE